MSEHRNMADSTPTIPDKLYFRIGEVAKLLGVETHTLRFWESEFPQLKVGKGGTGQRLYRRRDVETLLEIKQLLYSAGYTIPGARQFLQSRVRRKEPALATPTSPAPPQRAAGLQRLRADLRELSAQLGKPVSAQAANQQGDYTPRRPQTNGSVSSRRNGLHLANRAAPAVERALGLFDKADPE